MVYIVCSLVRRRVTRRLTRLQTICNVLKCRKILKTLRYGCGTVAFIFSIYFKPVLYLFDGNDFCSERAVRILRKAKITREWKLQIRIIWKY